MKQEKIYVGIYNDTYQGMTPSGNIVRDAWVFGLIPDEETCEGWSIGQMQELYDKVAKAWEPFGHLVSLLPSELRERHARIYDDAIRRARAAGWSPDMELEE